MHISPSYRTRLLRGLSVTVCACAAVFAGALHCLAEPPIEKDDPPAIRRLVSEHLTLYTDLPPGDEVDALPALFDQAFPQWCAYFGLDPADHVSWHVRAHLMRSRERFEAAGFVPAELHDFTSGYAIGDRLWCYDQTSDYYRRHLLLHEGTHAFMQSLLGGVGPLWYAEGMAELLATHTLEDGKLTLNQFPKSPGEVSKWGRIELVQTAFDALRAKTLERVFEYDAAQHRENEWYGWCWAAAAFFDGDPRYRARFRQLHDTVDQPDFTERWREALGDDWGRAQEDWQLFVANLDYGYDFARTNVEMVAGEPLPAEGARIEVAADRGWQSSGIRLTEGRTYRVVARGRYQVAAEPSVWWCEPGGVTIRYHDGLPLGILLAAVRADGAPSGTTGLIKPLAIGLESALRAPRDGTLYLRINESSGELSDNAGSLQVDVLPE